MIRNLRTVLICFGLQCAGNLLPNATVAQTDCAPPWVKRVAARLAKADATEIAQARAWYDRYHKVDEITARGMLKTVEAKDLDALLVTFQKVELDDLPFPGLTVEDRLDGMYRAIGELTGPDFRGVNGLEGKIGNIVSDSRSNQLGSILDVKVADDIARTTGDRSLIVFEDELIVPGTGQRRRYDVRQTDPNAPPPLRGITHENKNWPRGLQGGAADPFLREFADEQFSSDVLLHANSDFAFYQVNLRGKVLEFGQDTIVRDELLRVFDDPFIVRELGGQLAADAKKSLFQGLWDTRRVVEFH